MTMPLDLLSHSSGGIGRRGMDRNQFYSIQQRFNILLQVTIHRNLIQTNK